MNAPKSSTVSNESAHPAAHWKTGEKRRPLGSAISSIIPGILVPGAPPPAKVEAPETEAGSAKQRWPWQTRTGAYTFRSHWRYSALEGIHHGAFHMMVVSYILINVLMPDGATKSDKAVYTTLINWLPTLAMLTAPMWAVTAGQGKRYWLRAALLARLIPCAAVAFVSEPWHIVALMTFMAITGSGIAPVQNALFNRNYSRFERDRYHGIARLGQIVLLLATNVALMTWMDVWEQSFRVVLPVTGIIAAFGLVLMYRVKQRHHASDLPHALPHTTATPAWSLRRALRAIAAPYPVAWKLYGKNKRFLVFEIGFMFYGIAFMMLWPVIPVFYDQVFDIDYKTYGFHTMVAFFSVMFFSHILLRGRTSHWSAPRLALTAFTTLMGYPLLLLVAGLTEILWFAFGGFLFFGAGMAMVEYSWNYGPLQFANKDDPGPYLRTHTMMVGIRSLIAYPIAWLILSHSRDGDFRLSLAIPVVLFAISVAIMFSQWLGLRRSGQDPQEYLAGS